MWFRFLAVFSLAQFLVFPTAVFAEAQDAASDPESPEEPDRSPRVPTFPVQGDLAGELGVFETRYEDTFAGIGNRLAMGYLELVKANPDVPVRIQKRFQNRVNKHSPNKSPKDSPNKSPT